MSLKLQPLADGVRLWVRAKPRSSRSQVLGVDADGALAVALKSPPVDGAANAELLKLLARALGVRKSQLTLKSGASSKRKGIEVRGLDEEQVRTALGS